MGFLSSLFGDKPLPSPPELPFECIVVRGRDALARREELLAGATKPVILGDPEEASSFHDQLGDSTESVDDIVARSLALDVDGWIARQLRESEAYEQVPPAPWPADRTVGETTIAAHRSVLTRRPLPAYFWWD